MDALMHIDQVRLNFNPQALLALNLVLAFVMFGVALDLKIGDFKQALQTPKALAIGLFGHHLLFPAGTFALILLLEPLPSIALGMLLVSSCPAGHISNFFTQRAGGNTALSVSISTLVDGRRDLHDAAQRQLLGQPPSRHAGASCRTSRSIRGRC